MADSYGDVQEASYSFSRPPKISEMRPTLLNLCLGNLKDTNLGQYISFEIHHVTVAEETNEEMSSKC